MANPAEVKARGEMLDAMLNAYHDAMGEGCDANGAYDCMVEMAHSFLVVTQDDAARVARELLGDIEERLNSIRHNAQVVSDELVALLARAAPEEDK